MKKQILVVALAFVSTWTLLVLPFGFADSPRTGEYYQDTKARYVSPLSILCMRLGEEIPIVGWVTFLPLGYVGCGIEIAVVNPLRDTLMLPVDMRQPHHGYYVRVIDESGAPVPKAEVEVDGVGPSILFWSHPDDKGATDENGMVYFSHLNYLPSDIKISAEGFHLRRCDIFIVHSGDRDSCPDRAKGPSWSTDGEGRRVYTVRVFRRRRPTAHQRLRVDACMWGTYGAENAWTNGFDVVCRAWTPPRGYGFHADLIFSNELLPDEGGKTKHRLSISVPNEKGGLTALPMLSESDPDSFCTDYEVSDAGEFRKSIDMAEVKKWPIEKKVPSELPEPVDYIAYKVFRPKDGGKMYYGAFIQQKWCEGKFYLVANSVPGDRSLEPCNEGCDFDHKTEK